MSGSSVTPAAAVQQKGFLPIILRFVATICFFMFFSLIFSIISEWVGMSFFWPDEKVVHAKEMLVKELTYLDQDFKNNLIANDGMGYAEQYANGIYYALVQWTGLEQLIQWADRPLAADSGGGERLLHNIFSSTKDYIYSALYTIQTFSVRLAVIVMALPLFMIFFFIGLTEGLVRRDLRRWSGGRESSFLYTYSKKTIAPTFLSMWVVYLALPFSCHPNFVILPFGLLFALAVMVTAGSFKKYL